MSTFNAGAIKTTMTLDRTPFTTELRAAKAEAAEFVRNPISARLDVDTRRADAELRAFQGRVDIATRNRSTRLDLSTGSTDQALRDLQGRLNGVGTTNRKVAQDSKAEFSIMRTAIEQLVPIAVVAAGAVGAIGAGAVTLGITGLLAFKGINAEIKAGTPLGVQYAAGLATIKSELAATEKIAAGGVVSGYERSLQSIQQRLPGFNAEVSASSKILGNIGADLVDAGTGGFATFGDDINKAEGYVEKLADSFDKWANGPGGAKFAAALGTDLDHILPLLSQLGMLAVHLLSSINPVGLVLTDDLTLLSSALNKLPVGLLQAATIAYISFRTAVAVTSGLDAATAALGRLAGAETAAAATAGAGAAEGAATGIFGRFAAGASALVPIAGLAVGAAIGINFLAAATKNWQTSSNGLKADVGNTVGFLNDIIHFRNPITDQDKNADTIQKNKALQLGFNIHTLNGQGANTGVKLQNSSLAKLFPGAVPDQNASLSRGLAGFAPINDKSIGYNTPQYKTNAASIAAGKNAANVAGAFIPGSYKLQSGLIDANTKAIQQNAVALQEHQSYLAKEDKAVSDSAVAYQNYTTLNQQANAANSDAVNGALARTTSISDNSTAYSALENNINKNIKAEQTWTSTAKQNTVTIDGQKYSVTAANAALKLTNGNYAAAAGLLKGHTAALGDDQLALKVAQAQQANLNNAVGAAEAKYHLTGAQLDVYSQALGINADQLATGAEGADRYVASIGVVKKAIDDGNTATITWTTSLATFQAGEDTAAARGQLIGAALQAANGPLLQYATTMSQVAVANQQTVTDFDKVKKGVLDLKTGAIDYHNAGSGPLLADLSAQQVAAVNAAAATYTLEQSQHKAGAATDAFNVYTADTKTALEKEASQMGLTKTQADKLATKYFDIKNSGDLKKQIGLIGDDKVTQTLKSILTDLDIISNPQKIVIAADAAAAFQVFSNVRDAYGQLKQYTSSGIRLNVSGLGGVDGSSGGSTKNSAYGNIFYAAGGINEVHNPAIYSSAAKTRVFNEPEAGGEAYIPLRNDSRRPRAKAIAAETVSRLGGMAFFESGGFDGVTNGKTTTKKSSTSSTKTLKSLGISGSLASLETLANTVNRDLTSLVGLGVKTASVIEAGARAIYTAVQSADKYGIVTSATVTYFATENKDLTTIVNARDVLIARLKTQQQTIQTDQAAYDATKTATANTVLGGFDIGTSGNGYKAGILSSLNTANANATKFEKLRAQAKALGLDPKLLAQITAEGPTVGGANLAAIVAGGKSYVKQIDAGFVKLEGTAGAIGTEQAKETNGAALLKAQAEALKTQKEIKAAQATANEILAQIKAALDIVDKKILAAVRKGGGKV